MASCSNVGTHCRIEVAATVSGIFSFLLLMGTSKTEKGGDVSICNVFVTIWKLQCNKINIIIYFIISYSN